MVSSVLTHKLQRISSLKTTRLVVQFSSHIKNAALKSLTKLLQLRQLYVFHPSVLLLTIKIGQSARENSLSYCKIEFNLFYDTGKMQFYPQIAVGILGGY